MVADDLVSVLRNNMYAPMNTNIQNVWFFSKIRDEDMDIISVVNNCNGIAINGDDLDSIAFQVERKFLLNGRKNVNIQYIILSDNINTTILNTSLAFFPLQKRPTVTLTEAYVIHGTPSNNYRTNAATQQMPLTVSANNPTQSQSYS